MKICNTCKQEKELSSFHKDRHTKSGLCRRCADCMSAYQKEWYARKGGTEWLRQHRLDNPEMYFAAELKHHYKITVNVYNELLHAQDGRCAICQGPPNGGKKRLCIDHCHTSGKIRGLLCCRCNRGLGAFRDNTELLKKAAEYLI